MQREHYDKDVAVGDGSNLSIGIVVSSFNTDITEGMLEGAKEVLAAWKVSDITVVHVPGSFELPYGCHSLLSKDTKPDALIALGCIIKGETEHDRYIAQAVATGLIDLTLAHGVPISFGVITTNNLEQAVVRSTGSTNKGKEAAQAALHMALL